MIVPVVVLADPLLGDGDFLPAVTFIYLLRRAHRLLHDLLMSILVDRSGCIIILSVFLRLPRRHITLNVDQVLLVARLLLDTIRVILAPVVCVVLALRDLLDFGNR